MELYQEKKARVNGCVKVIDPEIIVERASEGLLQLSMELGLSVLSQMMEQDVEHVAGKKGAHQKARKAYRHGYEQSRVVMGGEKVAIARPRMRSLTGGELAIPSLMLFQNDDPLNQVILQRLLLGISTRKYRRSLEDGLEGTSCVSKSEASRRFIAGMETVMDAFFSRPITKQYPVLMMDGMELGKMTIVVAMGIDTDGKKQILGLREGGTENSEVVKDLLADLIFRGLNQEEARLYVLDGGKALHSAVKATFGERCTIQRCQVHKKRNVLSYLPESEHENVSIAMTKAYREFDYAQAKSALESLANQLEYRYPSAASSLREGLEETLTVHRLKVPGLLRQTLSSTNAMESANSSCARTLRRVSCFKNGGMTLRHAAAGFLEAERSFRRVRGYKQIPVLIASLKLLTVTDDASILKSA
mgnify:FL=1